MRNCTKCGTLLAEDNNFCPSCGTEQPIAPNVATPTTESTEVSSEYLSLLETMAAKNSEPQVAFVEQKRTGYGLGYVVWQRVLSIIISLLILLASLFFAIEIGPEFFFGVPIAIILYFLLMRGIKQFENIALTAINSEHQVKILQQISLQIQSGQNNK